MCRRRFDVNKSGQESIDCEHQRKNDDLRWLRPDGETQVQTISKQVHRIQLQPREQIVEVPIVLHFEQLVENPQLIAEAVVQVLSVWMYSMSTKNVPQVMEEIGEIVGSITRARSMAHC